MNLLLSLLVVSSVVCQSRGQQSSTPLADGAGSKFFILVV